MYNGNSSEIFPQICPIEEVFKIYLATPSCSHHILKFVSHKYYWSYLINYPFFWFQALHALTHCCTIFWPLLPSHHVLAWPFLSGCHFNRNRSLRKRPPLVSHNGRKLRKKKLYRFFFFFFLSPFSFFLEDLL